jgi:hypothetical protein
VLRKLDGTSSQIGLKWFIKEDEKLIVGIESMWRDHHLALVQEKTLANIKAKRTADGAELDDMAPLIALTKQQFREWVSQTPDFAGYELIFSDEDLPFWRLYAALSPQEKKLARSAKGLSLATLDKNWLSGIFQATQREQNNNVIYDNAARDRDALSKTEPSFATEVLSTITMRVVSQSVDKWQVCGLDDQGKPKKSDCSAGTGGPAKHTYRIELDGVKEGAAFHRSAPWYGTAFPVQTTRPPIDPTIRGSQDPAPDGVASDVFSISHHAAGSETHQSDGPA